MNARPLTSLNAGVPPLNDYGANSLSLRWVWRKFRAASPHLRTQAPSSRSVALARANVGEDIFNNRLVERLYSHQVHCAARQGSDHGNRIIHSEVVPEGVLQHTFNLT